MPRSRARGPGTVGGMRITYRVFLVGAIPITIAAAIALAALVLLNEADRARSGAVLAGTIYRNLLAARTARDDFLETTRGERTRFYELFFGFAEQARFDLSRLAGVIRDPAHATAVDTAADALSRYGDHMRELLEVTISNDDLVAEMAARADSLIELTDEARARQHESNADIVDSLTAGDIRLRVARYTIDRAQEVNAAVASVELLRARGEAPAEASESPGDSWTFELGRMRTAAAALSAALVSAGRDQQAADFGRLYAVYETSIAPVSDAALAAEAARSLLPPWRALSEWIARMLKVYSTEERALHDEVADLLTYSVQASETEHATQNIAIETLKLGSQTAEALGSRDTEAAAEVLDQSSALSETVGSLPISPLIQTEMLDAIDQWRNGLATTIEGLNEQNRILEEMDGTAARMIEGARFLDAMLTRDAERIGDLVRNILIFGAAIGLLLGSVTGLAVARSITRPLRRLQQRMMELADNSRAGPIEAFDRRDELGDMARATNVFLTEIGRREMALRQSKDRADAALAELQKTQTDLIQAEKLASLGNLVAGVAHEINTPLGIALTTSTLIGDEAKRFADAAASGKLQRSVLERFVTRMREGTQLLFSNLTRAADLVHSFKQVAADQASGERRKFDMDEWLQDLLTSLSPVLRKTKHEVTIECTPGVSVDTYPGALGQVLTNLLTNAMAHAYDEGQAGKLAIRVSEPRLDVVRIVFSDDGKGIPPENLGKVFDPFFTTGRSAGSTGLGLHIVYNLVTSRLQGRIDLYSKLGKGTRFTIEIPKVATESAPEDVQEKLLQLQGA
jgi:signal transduction histidine kinase